MLNHALFSDVTTDCLRGKQLLVLVLANIIFFFILEVHKAFKLHRVLGQEQNK